jgi:outer membrane usher protein
MMASGGLLAAAPAPVNLQLNVIINGVSTNLIASFVQYDDGRIAATAGELTELGIRTPPTSGPNVLVGLSAIPSASYKYDEAKQQIAITIADAQRIPRDYDINGSDVRTTVAPSVWGGVLNYNVFLSADNVFQSPASSAAGSLTLDGRVFSPFGTFSQSAFLHADPVGQARISRLDSTYRYSDLERLIVYQAGDLINGGLSWTRPIRVGGVQARKNFALRPDLVTVPLPNLSGTAAVPSTVDVYINNLKMFSVDVGAGPFTFSDFPVISGAGDARIVIRDASGRETTTTVPFYSAPQLLAPGLTSFSAEAGLPRLGYGSASDAYPALPVASATARHGLYEWLTVEGHAEAAAGLINAGGGAVSTFRGLGTLSGAISGSLGPGQFGAQTYVGLESRLSGITLNLSSLHSFGQYNDLASRVAQLAGSADPALAATGPVRALDRITVSTLLPFDRKSSVSASFLHSVDGAGHRSDVVSASWSRSVGQRATVFASGFTDLEDLSRNGVFVGISQRLDGSASASASVAASNGSATANVAAVKPLGPDVGAFGWRVQDTEGAVAFREAALAYRAPVARLEGIAGQSPDGFRGAVGVEGSVATIGGRVFLTNRIDDAFAVVRVGVPNVPVMYDNRPLGVTDAQGMILVPSLRSFDRNKISIDPIDLPVDAEIETTRTIIAPADRAGVLVDFGVRIATSSALVVFTGAEGGFLPVGSTGRSETGEEFIVGYDGQGFLRDLGARNAVTIETPQGRCRATFAYAPRGGEQVVISPVVCRPVAGDTTASIRGSKR